MLIDIVNGPNLGRLGRRQPEVYGQQTWDEIFARLRERWQPDVELQCFQSNHEGALVDYLESAPDRGVQGIVLNPGALTHQSYVLRDALAALEVPVVEVHLSNIHARERFRRRSLTAPVVWGQISGLGWIGYHLAVAALVERLAGSTPAMGRLG